MANRVFVRKQINFLTTEKNIVTYKIVYIIKYFTIDWSK